MPLYLISGWKAKGTMKNTYNGMTFEEIKTELVSELNKMTAPELQEFKEKWLEAIQIMPPKAKSFCSHLMDIMIDIKEREQLQKDVAALEHMYWVCGGTPLGDTLFAIAKETSGIIESIMNSYNLGKIHGIRQERARRRK